MRRRFTLLSLPILALVAAIGGSYLHFETERSEEQAKRDLSSVAHLKAEQVNAWLKERQGDAEALRNSLNFSLRVEQVVSPKATAEDRRILLSRLETLRDAYGYDTAMLLDRDARIVLEVGDAQDVSPQLQAQLDHSPERQESRHGDLYSDGENHVHIDWVVPIRAQTAAGERVIAHVVLRAAPLHTLYPNLLTWPTASESAEVTMARREGDEVVLLTDLGDRKTGFNARFPVSTKDIPCAVAVSRGGAGSLIGIEPNGQPIIAAFDEVPGTGWSVVAKVARYEVMRPMWRNFAWLLMLSALGLLGVFVLLWRLLGQQEHLKDLAIAGEKARANARLKALGDNLPNGMVYQYQLGPDGCRRFEYVSAGVERLFGHTPEQVLAEPALLFAHLDDAMAAFYFEREAQSARDLSVFAIELCFRQPGQPPLWLTLNSSPQRLADGTVLWDGLAVDISERKAAEEALAGSEARFRNLFNESAQALSMIEDGRFVAANQAMLSLLGMRSVDELIGLTPLDISPPVQPDGRRSAERVPELIETVARSGHYTFDWEHLRRDGTPFTGEVIVTQMRQELVGHQRWHVVVRDVTLERQSAGELKRYREHLEQLVEDRTAELASTAAALSVANEEQMALFQAASVGICYVRDRMVLRCNRALEQFFGYGPDEMLGHTTQPWYADEGVYAEIGQTIATALREKGVYREDRYLFRKDRTTFWGRMTAQLVDRNDPARGLVGIVEDISVERHAFEEMARARAIAEEAARVKSDFVANMSHEIRTPMNAVIGLAHLLQSTPLSERQRDYLDKIRGSSQHLLGIINDILDFSKIEAGKLNLEHIEFQLERVLDQVSTLVIERLSAKGLELVIDVAPDVPVQLLGDPLRVGQVLTNYLNNALKFTEHGEIAVTVTVDREIDKDLLLRFQVRDSGVGIAPDQIDRLFRSFEQADTSTTRKYGGTGLGLAISKRLAEMMGGEVGVDSEVGKGATFWFTARLGKGSGRLQSFEPRPDLRHRHVLVVDDNAFARQVMGGMLGRMTFRVASAADGEEALGLLLAADRAGDPFEVAFLDWQMPTMDGLALAERITELPLSRQPARAIFTAYGRDELLVAARALGIEHVLIKPVAPSILFDTVMALLGGSPRPKNKLSDEPSETGDLGGFKALLVEDNELNQQVAAELLDAIGIAVDIAEDGAQGVRMAGENRYDVVLMDMQMPVMDGLEATRRIRQLPGWAEVPIIAMTANAMAVDRERCLAAGMNDHLAKPIDPALLRTTLSHWLGARPVTPPMPVTPVVAAAVAEPAVSTPPAGGLVGGLDTAEGLRLAMGRQEFYQRLLRRFSEVQSGAVDALRDTLLEQNNGEATRLAHSLKGLAAQIGAHQVAKQANVVETLLRQPQAPDADTLTQALAELESGLHVLLADIDVVLAGHAEHLVAPSDGTSIATLSRQLAEYLRTDDYASLELLEREEATFKTALGPRYRVILNAVQNFDYEQALTQLQLVFTPEQLR